MKIELQASFLFTERQTLTSRFRKMAITYFIAVVSMSLLKEMAQYDGVKESSRSQITAVNREILMTHCLCLIFQVFLPLFHVSLFFFLFLKSFKMRSAGNLLRFPILAFMCESINSKFHLQINTCWRRKILWHDWYAYWERGREKEKKRERGREIHKKKLEMSSGNYITGTSSMKMISKGAIFKIFLFDLTLFDFRYFEALLNFSLEFFF